VQQKLFMILTAFAAAMCVVYLQQRFDAADMKNCVNIAQTYRAPSGKSLPDLLAERYPGAVVDWAATETSSCFQHVRVDARITPKDAPPVVYEFEVDLNGPSIHPANPLGVQALEVLDGRGTGGGGPR
jgi:hypothetical protein